MLKEGLDFSLGRKQILGIEETGSYYTSIGTRERLTLVSSGWLRWMLRWMLRWIRRKKSSVKSAVAERFMTSIRSNQKPGPV